MISIVL